MDAGKDIAAASSVAAVAAARQVAATDAIGLLTPRGGISTTDITRSKPAGTPTPDPNSSSPPSAPTVTELSPGAQLLLRLLGAESSPALPLKAAQALLPEPPSMLMQANAAGAAEPAPSAGTLIARALQSGLEHSGLFYESHLADWVAGQRSLAAIHAEPQAAWHSATRADAAAASIVPTASTGSSASATAETASTPAQLNAIVGAQLEVIDSGQLRWQGELWPGMPAELWLQREPGQNDADRQGQNTGTQASDDEDRRHWQARLVTTLPSLGKISTRFSLQGDKLELSLSCAQPATAGALQSASAQLVGSLTAAGIQLQGFRSEHDDAGPAT